MGHKIQIENLYKIFGPRPNEAIRLLKEGCSKDEIMEKTKHGVGVVNASFYVDEGEIVVVMGLSGSGKSTLVRCNNRLIEPTEGRVIVEGEDVTRLSLQDLRKFRQKHFGMVFQNFALFPHRTVLHNTEYGLEIQGVDPEIRKESAMQALEQVGLKGWEDSKPSQLSGGMQQRVGLARALATDAGILLMDEPFSALDPLIREHLQDELIQLQNALKKTIIFVSHDLDEALKLGSLIAIMDDGKIVQTGTPDDIVANPANDYVRKFVASMNPLKVLNCASLMRPVSELESVDGNGKKSLDSDQKFVCSLDKHGRPLDITHAGVDISLVPFRDNIDLKTLPRNVLVSADLETPMKAAVEINYVFGLPMPVIDELGRLLGVVGTDEIFGGILGENG